MMPKEGVTGDDNMENPPIGTAPTLSNLQNWCIASLPERNLNLNKYLELNLKRG
jgi:hypothetical protein